MLIKLLPLLVLIQIAHAHTNGLGIFDRVWKTAKDNIYPSSLKDRFTESARSDLRKEIEKDPSLNNIKAKLDPFLSSLGISHTGFYTNEDETFYFLKATFTNFATKVGFIGVQTVSSNRCKMLVREVLDGFPAERIGIRRGDCLETLNGHKLKSIQQFTQASPKKNLLSWTRQEEIHKAQISIQSWNLADAFFEATQRSTKIFEMAGKKIGYVHLWSGTHPKSSEFLQEIVNDKFKNTDGLILDLRGGYGGAWWEHLEPFFENTNSFFTATQIHTDGSKDVLKCEVKNNPTFYKKPMVVMINEGVRSGKEALAYQFRKTKRAVLIGNQTSGNFVAGKPFFVDEKSDYVLYLSVNGLLVDDVNLEGHGVEPNIVVDYPFSSKKAEDPQLRKAKEEIYNQVRMIH